MVQVRGRPCAMVTRKKVSLMGASQIQSDVGLHFNFDATMYLQFIPHTGCELDTSVLHRAVHQAHKECPWVISRDNGVPYVGSYATSTFAVLEGPHVDVGRAYQLEMRLLNSLSHAHLTAYERYARRMARDLATRELEGVLAVRARVEFGSSFATFPSI